MAKTCATCEHWSGRFGGSINNAPAGCGKITTVVEADCDCGELEYIDTPHDFGCILHPEMAEEMSDGYQKEIGGEGTQAHGECDPRAAEG